ncbi:MAG TPA: hypothetical protein VN670_09135, partial [Acidobacteriaceae bacterium]|nr:hypothetical protein [Acidobacteriaceae bacterium]
MVAQPFIVSADEEVFPAMRQEKARDFSPRLPLNELAGYPIPLFDCHLNGNRLADTVRSSCGNGDRLLSWR